MKHFPMPAAALLGLLAATGAVAQDAPGPTDKKVEYSPYLEENYPNRVFFQGERI